MWTKGAAYPAPQEHVLKLPFRFVLPRDLPPSCEYRTVVKSGVVAYSVEVVGVRAGLLHFNKRLTQSLPLLPHNAPGAELRDVLRLGWGGKMRSVQFPKKIRKGIWGDYSDVLATVSFDFTRG